MTTRQLHHRLGHDPPAHPARARIDRALGQLIAVGVAEAHDLEGRVTAAAEAATVALVRRIPPD